MRRYARADELFLLGTHVLDGVDTTLPSMPSHIPDTLLFASPLGQYIVLVVLSCDVDIWVERTLSMSDSMQGMNDE